MNQKAKNITAITGILLILSIGTGVLIKNKQSDDYIFDKDSQIKMSDVKNLRRSVDFEGVSPSEIGIPSARSDQSVNEKGSSEWSDGKGTMMLKYFRFLQSRFNSSTNIATHCTDVWKYLLSVMPKNEAEKIYSIYRKYLDCEIELAKKISELGQQPKTLDEILEKLATVQDIRREMLGAEMADALYGAEIKSREYSLRRGSIVANKDLYGEEKEKEITRLTSDMWSETADQVQSIQNPYNRYMEKLEIYKKDLGEMTTAEEKNARISDFRRQIFTPETVAKLEEVDLKIEADKALESKYREKEKEILEASMPESGKEAAIDRLRSELFGEDKDAFVRREAIRKGRQDAMASFSKNSLK